MTSPYLLPAPGRASFNLLKMAREGLMLPLRAAITKAKKQNQRVRRENVQIDQDGQFKYVSLKVIPLKNVRDRNFLILFESVGAGLVAGEFVRLQQVLWNLLTNAIKFTPNEGRVDVQTKSMGTHVAIVISDTGAGIPANFLPYVFERFQQADASEKRTHGGLGLGLSIVRNLAEMHGGSVSAESEGEGRGARFTVTLPTLAASGVTASLLASQDGNPEFSISEKERHREDSEEQRFDLEPDILKGVRILAVDDQADTRDLIILALTRYGAEVRACTSAIEACTMIKKWKPEVIVSDIGMPDEDGYDLMRKIRALTPEGGGTIPAVARTGYAGAVDESKAYAAGYQVHMTKPVELRELAATVAKLAGRSKDLTHTAASRSNP
jgi:CheY-like chemotaxis protein/anti-sigma regulatory factor (Ser/Thr protein kinase)